MSFSVTLKVADKDLGPLLAKLGAKTKYDLKHHTHDEPDVTNGKVSGEFEGMVSANTYIMRTDQADPPGKGQSQVGLALHEFEKLEAKHGIGEITRRMLTKRLEGSVASPTSVITQVISQGWVTGIQVDE